MPFQAQSQQWPADRAVLLVHGVGNATRGDYDDLVTALETLLGDEAEKFAIYQLFYDSINDWFEGKLQVRDRLNEIGGLFKRKLGEESFGDKVSEFVFDVLWPVLSQSARSAVREAYLAQLKQIKLDGLRSRVPARRQKLSIIAHSLGCFHTYEALHAAARFKSHRLQPQSHGVSFDNVIFMASPVQLIRSVASFLGPVINKRWMEMAGHDQLHIPSEAVGSDAAQKSVRNWISITGELDPVGGYFFRERIDWAYMDVKDQISRVDKQQLVDSGDEDSLIANLKASIRSREKPEIKPENPHSWSGYVARHEEELKSWLAG